MTTNFNFSVDLSDPRVRQMLGAPDHLATGKRDVVRLAGDERSGLSSIRSLTTLKQEVVVLFGDVFMTLDVYVLPGEPMTIHLYCPRCTKHSRITGKHKEIAFDPMSLNPQIKKIRASGNPELVPLEMGRLSIEAFECPWEMGDDQHVQGGVHTGVSLCRMRLVIDDNVAREV